MNLNILRIIIVINLAGLCLAHSEQNPLINRQRLRAATRTNVKNKIMSMLNKQQSGDGGAPQRSPQPNPVDVTERIQSFFPECNVDDYYWRQLPEDTTTSYLMYNIKFPSTPAGSTLRVADARLRLYMQAASHHQDADNFVAGGAMRGDGTAASDDTENCSSEERFRITVSWLQMKNHHSFVADSVMLDSSMVDQSYTGWLSFNVIGAARNWYRHKHRPAAIAIQVEDMRRRPIKASEILHTSNCTDTGANDSLRSGRQQQQQRSDGAGAPGHGVSALPGNSRDYSEHDTDKSGSAPSIEGSVRPILDITSVQFPDETETPQTKFSQVVAAASSSQTTPPAYPDFYRLDEELQKVQEIDYLGPDFYLASLQDDQPMYLTTTLRSAPSLVKRNHLNPSHEDVTPPLAATLPAPMNSEERSEDMKMIMSVDDMLQRLNMIKQIKQRDRVNEDILIRDFVNHLVKNFSV